MQHENVKYNNWNNQVRFKLKRFENEFKWDKSLNLSISLVIFAWS